MARLTEAEKIKRHRLEGAVLNTKHALKGAKDAFVEAAKAYAATGKVKASEALIEARVALDGAWDAVGQSGHALDVFDKAVEDRHAAAKAPKGGGPSVAASTGATDEE